jgi:predicted outer membrane repeat protein
MDTERGGTTKIRIQSNGRPDHCYYSPAVSPRDVDIDFEVDFNTHVGTEVRLSPTTQSDIDALLCNSTTVSDAALSESSAYKRYAYNEPMKFPVAPDENLNKIVGIALNGVPYISSLDGANTDMWGGTTRERVEEPIDSCLGYVTPNGMYSYPMIPVCIHDRRDNTTTHDVAHPDNARYLCSFSDDGYEGCQNRTRHAMDEYLSLTHSSRRSEKTQYETHHSGLDYKGANNLVYHYRRLSLHHRRNGARGRRLLSLEESPYIGMPKFFVRVNTRELIPSYTISGAAANPTLTLERGQSYIFEVLTHAHPFMIQYTNNPQRIGVYYDAVGTAGTAYTKGVTVTRKSYGDSGYSGVDHGTIVFDVPLDAPPTLMYRCTKHGINIQGEIRIHDPGATELFAIGCDGITGSSSSFDDCGVCGGSNLNKDFCGECFGDNSTCTGCDGVVNSGKTLDVCGVCGGNSSCVAEKDIENKIAQNESPLGTRKPKSAPVEAQKKGQQGPPAPARNTEMVIGLAKDGHMIFGPYYKDGTEATSGHDVCNGVHFDVDDDKNVDVYGYFARTTFPYVVGCYGPGNYPQVYPSCTSNPPPAYLPWLNFTYPGVAPPPFDNGKTQPLPKPNTVVIAIRTDLDTEATSDYSCDRLEKFVNTKIKTIMAGVSLDGDEKQVTVNFESPFLNAPYIESIQVASTQSHLSQKFNFAVKSVSTTGFVFTAQQKNMEPWKYALHVTYTASAHEKHEKTLRCAVVQMGLIDGAQSVFGQFVNISTTTLLQPLVIAEARSIVVNGSTSGATEMTEVLAGNKFGKDFLEALVTVATPIGQSVTFNRIMFSKCVSSCIAVRQGATLRLNSVVFQDNGGLTNTGGAMTILGGGSAFMSNTKFFSNIVRAHTYEAKASGGAVFVAKGGVVEMFGGGFEKNVATNSRGDAFGGAVVNWGSLTIIGALIQHNVAQGGLMDRYGESGAVGHGRGGAFSNHGTYFMVKDSTIYNNSASRSGGAIYTTELIRMRKCLVRNNSAYMGSAYRSPSYVQSPDLENCDIFWNSCSGERSSAQAETESYFPGQKTIPNQLAYTHLQHQGIPPKQTSYYDNL